MVSQTLNPHNNQTIAVITVPLPAQGHLNALLHLSAHLAARRIVVHYVGSAAHNRQARLRLHGWNLSSLQSHLHFNDLSFPSLPSPPPNPLTHKFPTHLQPAFDATTAHLVPLLSSLIRSLSLSHRRIVLLHDYSMSFVGAAASSSPKTESFAFHASSAISNLFFHGKAELCRAKFSSCFSEEFIEWVWRQRSLPKVIKGRLFNSCRSIEGEFLRQLESEPSFDGDRVFAVGPLNPMIAADRGEREDECLKWLDRQPAASVVYVSFGTTTTMSRRQMREIAAGLEESGERFVWVRREADRCDVFEGREEGEEDLDLGEWEER